MKIFFTLLISLIISNSGFVYSQINTFPYVQTGDLPIGWNVIQSTPIWSFGNATMNPAGKADDAAVICNFYSYLPGPEGIVVSPAFNFTLLNNPVLHFYAAHTSYDTQNDSVQILVSTDAGNTFINTPVPYRKSYNSIPSLSTVPATHTQFNPTAVNQWRHETINLAAYAGMNNIMIGLRGVCYFGNNFWVDNFIIADADNYCQQTVTTQGVYICSNASVTFNTTGLNGFSNNKDNPTGGVVSFSQHSAQSSVYTLANPEIATNISATSPDGSVFTPNKVAPDSWFTISYTGNDINGYANYNISIDISGFTGIDNPEKLYIVKRADLTGSWECLNTSRSGNVLSSYNLTYFSDFAVAGDSIQNPLPVELSSFTFDVIQNDVKLIWTTVSETNNSAFNIERHSNINSINSNHWELAGIVNGNGTSGNLNYYSFMDKNLHSGKYFYRLKQIDFNGNFKYYNLDGEVNVGTPVKFSLSQNYPNPFNPVTVIEYQIPEFNSISDNYFVNLIIYDVNGKLIESLVNEKQNSGYFTVNFNAVNLPSGVYFYKLNVRSGYLNKNFSETKRMMLIK